jgi:hypothetical protein
VLHISLSPVSRGLGLSISDPCDSKKSNGQTCNRKRGRDGSIEDYGVHRIESCTMVPIQTGRTADSNRREKFEPSRRSSMQ